MASSVAGSKKISREQGLSRELRAAKQAALEAGKVLLKNFRRNFSYRKKSPTDFVSDIDIKAEKTILKILAPLGHSMFSEEAGMIGADSEYTWYIDPLDGTHNYIHGIDPFAVSIGLTSGTSAILGVIFIPRTNELYYAVKGKGAWLNGKKIKVSGRSFKDAMISVSSKFRVNPEVKVTVFKELSKQFEMVRFHGSSAQNFCWLASGNIDAIATFNLPPHDIAAGFIIMKEAGARITDFSGKSANFKTRQFLITNGKLHRKTLATLSKHKSRLDKLIILNRKEEGA